MLTDLRPIDGAVAETRTAPQRSGASYARIVTARR
jgi:hypothetical protein